MSTEFMHTYNTVIDPATGPAGLVDYNGEGGDASISKKVYVVQSFVGRNSINVARDGSQSTMAVQVKVDHDEWSDIRLVSNTVLNALADARINSPLVIPTYIYDAIVTKYNCQPLDEQHWEVDVVYDPLKPNDPNSDSNSEGNPNNDFTQDPTVTYKGNTRLEQIPRQQGIVVESSKGLFLQKAYDNPTFKKIENGVYTNATFSVPSAANNFSVQKTYPVGTITAAFKKTITELASSVNKNTFDGYTPKSVMFVGTDYSFDATNKEIVTYNFQHKSDVSINYTRYNHQFFEGDWQNALLQETFDEILNNPQNIDRGGIPLLGNNNETIVARGWDVIQFSYQRIGHDQVRTGKDRVGSISVTTGHQVIRSSEVKDFDVLGLGL